jgi:hypothetical protein
MSNDTNNAWSRSTFGCDLTQNYCVVRIRRRGKSHQREDGPGLRRCSQYRTTNTYDAKNL